MSSSMSFEQLTPTAFLRRSAAVYGSRVAVVDGDRRWTYAELWDRSRGLAGGLAAAGGGDGARVAVLGANSHLLLEAHYGVPLAGGVLVALNTRLSASELAYVLDHSGARLLLCDAQLAPLAHDAAEAAGGDVRVVEEGDEYEGLVCDSRPLERPVADERDLLAINYTSGTTGRPKGVMYHHRGAYLQALAMAFHSGMGPASTFLWTLPMFHCNGWCFTWAVTATGGTHLCLRKVDPSEIWRLIHQEDVTHFNAAPTVLTSLAYHPDAQRDALATRIRIATGGAPPSPTLLARLAELRMDVTHLYGLTESFGPVMISEWQPEWDALPDEERARRKARQGVGNMIAERPRVVGDDGVDVPADGETLGEVVLRGNDVMLGYYRDPEATERAQLDGWFRTGDLGVVHPDGYVELRDRSKDVIISGGENITSVEVEQAIASHPAVLEVAVIPVPDVRWGERPAAYVTLKAGREATADGILEHVRARLARFKVPRDIVFVDELPKTATGKIQKYVLRERAWAGHERRIG
jgi:fatty-acyl-CoA synthase